MHTSPFETAAFFSLHMSSATMIPAADALRTYHRPPSSVSNEYQRELDLQEARVLIKEAAVQGKHSVSMSVMKDHVRSHLEKMGYSVAAGSYAVRVSWDSTEHVAKTKSAFPTRQELLQVPVWPFENANVCALNAMQLHLQMTLEKSAADGLQCIDYRIPSHHKLESFDTCIVQLHLIRLLKTAGYFATQGTWGTIIIDWRKKTLMVRLQRFGYWWLYSK